MQKNFLAVIRHGERADHVSTCDKEALNYDNKHDPPLTEKGQEQAIRTG